MTPIDLLSDTVTRPTVAAGGNPSGDQARPSALRPNAGAGAAEHLGGRVPPPAYVDAASARARSRAWATHPESACLFNAATALRDVSGRDVEHSIPILRQRLSSNA